MSADAPDASPLRVLLVEDDPNDAALVMRELKLAGHRLQCERIDTPEALAAALARQPWDIVISDYQMPCLTRLGPSVARALQEAEVRRARRRAESAWREEAQVTAALGRE